MDPHQEIIDYLNKATGKRFRSNSRNTQNLISGRIYEGYKVDDFKAVIDNRVAVWGKDPRMQEYLRPKTLFNPGNFENYLNASIVPTKQKRPDPVFDDDGFVVGEELK